MTTAFQPTAFQNNAFQIDGVNPSPDTHDGADGYYRRYHEERYLKNQEELAKLRGRYEDVQSIDDGILLSAVEPFVDPLNEEEMERRYEAKYIIDKAPDAERIDFLSLLENQLAMTRLQYAIEMLIQKQEIITRMRRDEEDFFMLACLIATKPL